MNQVVIRLVAREGRDLRPLASVFSVPDEWDEHQVKEGETDHYGIL